MGQVNSSLMKSINYFQNKQTNNHSQIRQKQHTSIPKNKNSSKQNAVSSSSNQIDRQSSKKQNADATTTVEVIRSEKKTQQKPKVPVISKQPKNKQNLLYYCQILDLTVDEDLNFKKIKKSFQTKIRSYAHLRCQKQNIIIEDKRKKRIQILLAYQYITNKIFGHKYSIEKENFIDAIFKDEKQKVFQMVSENKQLLGFKTKFKQYPVLYLAAMSGHVNIVETILKTGCSLNFMNDKSSPIHIAAWCGHYHVVKLLLRYNVPHNLQNKHGNLPIIQATGAEIQDLLKQADKDIISQLIHNLIKQDLCHTVINIYNKGEIVIKKIILQNYYKQFGNNYVDAFHGTKFESLCSIAKHGLKKPGTKVQDLTIEVCADNIKKDQEYNGVQNWGEYIYVTPSIYYSSKYSEFLQIFDERTKEKSSWKSIVQVKVKKQRFKKFGDTTAGHGESERVSNQPQDLEYQIQDEENVSVVAILIIKRSWLGQFKSQKQPDYNVTNKFILYGDEELTARSYSFIQ